MLPSPLGNSPLAEGHEWESEGLQEPDLSDCVSGSLGHGGSPLCWSKLLWHTQITAQHAVLQLFLSYNLWTLLLLSIRNATSFRVYVWHNNGGNRVMFNGEMLNL